MRANESLDIMSLVRVTITAANRKLVPPANYAGLFLSNFRQTTDRFGALHLAAEGTKLSVETHCASAVAIYAASSYF